MLSVQEIQTDTNHGEITLSSQSHQNQRETRKRNTVGIDTRSIFFVHTLNP